MKDLNKMKKNELIENIERLNELVEFLQQENKQCYNRIDDSRLELKALKFQYNKKDLECSNLLKDIRNIENKHKEETEKLQNEIEKLKENNQKVHKIKNERNAGRKKKFDDEVIEKIIQARSENKSIRTIAKEFECSVGLVQKIINEHKE